MEGGGGDRHKWWEWVFGRWGAEARQKGEARR